MRSPEPRSARRGLTVAALVAALVAGLVPAAAAGPHHPRSLPAFDAVDPFIGTELDTTQNKGNSAYGNTWPGATVPFGMVQSSPTTYRSSDGDAKGGYEYTADRLRGFGMTRLSGTGCEGRNSGFDFPVLPFTGELAGRALPANPAEGIEDYYLGFDHADEHAEPGYYSVELANGVETELTATTRTAVSRFDFPRRGDATLLLDVSGSNNRVLGSGVHIEGNTVSGWVESATVCDEGGVYKAYFSATFDRRVISFGTWDADSVDPGSRRAEGSGKHRTGAYLTFADGADVTARVGLSYVSVENAARNAAHEAGWASFERIRAKAARTWRDALGTVNARGGTGEQRTKFYTALYHSLLHPNVFDDVNGQYRGYDGEVHRVARGRHHYVNYAGWDTYRSQAQLVALLFPRVGDDMNQSIVDMVTQSGRWPNWPHLNQPQQKMSGDSLQSVVASIDAFGSTRYDRRAALESMVTSQSLPAESTRRAHAYQYFSTGLIENRKGGAATSTVLEYAIDDFGIAQLARRLGDEANYRKFMVRAQNWQNVFDSETRHIRPRDRNGFDRGFNLGERGNQFDQATGYQYGWMVPHNVGTLVEKRGGIEATTAALDDHTSALDAGVYNTADAYLSNQPSFSMPFVYNWLRKPHRTTDVLHRAVSELYDTSPSGLPGNDDLGSLSSWYVWANLGLFPSIYGTADLVVSAPMFESITIRSEGGHRTIRISAPGASTHRYTTGLRVNGRATTASWLPESFARHGGTLRFTMGSVPGTWGTGAKDVPPSYTDGSDARNNVGTTPRGRGDLGSLDLSDNSLNRDALAAEGITPGAPIPFGDTGVEFTWPDAAPGEPDNWIPHGQRVELGGRHATGISFLGLATNGPAQGTATVHYADGSTQDVRVQLTDWTPGTNYLFGNQPVVEVTGRNHVSGSTDSAKVKVFATAPQPLDSRKRVAAVTLPQGTDRGIMHIFDVGLTTKPDLDVPEAEPERIVLNPTANPATSQAITWRTGSVIGEGEVRIREAGAGDWRTVAARRGLSRSWCN